MKVLLVNKFLYPKGGAETYVFKLGEALKDNGHEVEYFGLENEKNIVGNSANAYAPDMDLTAGISENLLAPFKIIYSRQARRQIKKVLESFKPDVVHLNNIQFYLTPSIILEIEKYRKTVGKKVKIIYTAHDYQLVCPSHGLFDSNINVCEKCMTGNYMNCVKSRCMKNSLPKSILATADAYFWKLSTAYSYVDTIICPSYFLKIKLDTQPRFKEKTVVIHNFIEKREICSANKGGYVLEFGHLSKDKGTLTLLEAARQMPEVKFVFAGFGKAVEEIEKVPNAEYVGFKTGEELNRLIANATVTVCPSEWYENCPYSVMESLLLGTPVVGADIGGIPELIRPGETGELFESGNRTQLSDKLYSVIRNADYYTENCKSVEFETPKTYYQKLFKIYGE